MSTWKEEHWDTMNMLGKVGLIIFWIIGVPAFWGIWFYGIYKLLD